MMNEHKKGVKAMKYTVKPKNPVAKAHQTVGSGSGSHKDKKKATTQVRGEKHKSKSADMAESYFTRLEKMTENAQMLDEILDPSGKWATAWRIVGNRFAKAFPWLAGGVGVGTLAAAGVLAPMVAAAGGWAAALTTLTAGETLSGLGMTAIAAPTIIQQIKSFFSADEESISAIIRRWVETKVGDDADVKEFVLLHAKSVLEGKPTFRWRAQEWKTYLSAKQAEAYLEKNDKYWLDTFNQQKAEKEKSEQSAAEIPEDNTMNTQTTSAVDAKGRTQQQWMKLVKAKFPTARIAQAKMMNGPIIAYLDDGRKLYWNKAEQSLAEGSAHGYNVTRYYRKYRDQSKITKWLKKEAGLPKETKLYFDDADLVLGSDTIVPYALVDETLKFNDLLTALVQATGGTPKEKTDGVYRDQNTVEADELRARGGIEAVNKKPRPGQTNFRDIPAGNYPGSQRKFSDKDREEQPGRLKAAIKSTLGKHTRPNLPENYPKQQDLSGISTDKLKAYLAKQGQQQGSGEGNQVKRVRAELQSREQGVAEGADDKFSVADKVEQLVDQYRLYDKRGWTDLFAKLAGRKLKGEEIYREMEYASKFLQLLDSIRMRSDYRGQQDPRKDQELIDLSNQWINLFNKAADEFKGMSGQGVAEGFDGEYDDEAGMAQSNLHTLVRTVDGLLKTIEDNDNLPEWCQEKIAKAEMMLVSVWDYLLSQKEMGRDPKIGQSSIAESNWYEIRLAHLLESNLKK